MVDPRSEAKALGLKYYSTGRPCLRGHMGNRWVSGGACVVCGRAAGLKYHAENRDKANAGRLARKLANLEGERARGRARYRANPDYFRAKQRAWEAANPDKMNQKSRNKRARKAAAAGRHGVADIREIRRLQKNKCAYCRVDLDSVSVHVDHIVPLAAGGANDRGNLQLTCATCNMDKRDRHPVEYAQSLGRLI